VVQTVVALPRSDGWIRGCYEQQPPPQHPPPEGAGPWRRPPTETAENSLTVSVCPAGQAAGASDSAIGRVCSKVAPHARQRYS